jgi:hypothetical protein
LSFSANPGGRVSKKARASKCGGEGFFAPNALDRALFFFKLFFILVLKSFFDRFGGVFGRFWGDFFWREWVGN